ncbi:hypothetical protein [Phaffia rhodozyma]|uniref:Roadblock/LAMTOR2 domain-containing protein n=1 Tax=Phaffia rhodozyma TaxID=264483 RepID=A0A0F7SGT6_PHARH|nr:hypothetical protein [Phaffia rhodozyma]
MSVDILVNLIIYLRHRHALLQPSPSSSFSASTSTTTTLPPQLASLLLPLSQSRSVLGVLVLSRTANSYTSTANILQAQGAPFEGSAGKDYAGRVAKMVAAVEEGCIAEKDDDTDTLKFLRIRTTKHELIITPSPAFILVVLHEPGQAP